MIVDENIGYIFGTKVFVPKINNYSSRKDISSTKVGCSKLNGPFLGTKIFGPRFN